jgi:hypothetical protein
LSELYLKSNAPADLPGANGAGIPPSPPVVTITPGVTPGASTQVPSQDVYPPENATGGDL